MKVQVKQILTTGLIVSALVMGANAYEGDNKQCAMKQKLMKQHKGKGHSPLGRMLEDLDLSKE